MKRIFYIPNCDSRIETYLPLQKHLSPQFYCLSLPITFYLYFFRPFHFYFAFIAPDEVSLPNQSIGQIQITHIVVRSTLPLKFYSVLYC